MRLVLEEWPGANHVLMRIVTLDGRRPVFRWRAYASGELRTALGRLLAARATKARASRPAEVRLG